jgi:hypothetical protein
MLGLSPLEVAESVKPKPPAKEPPKYSKLTVNETKQPIYSTIDALGLVVSTVRISEPTRFSLVKEPDGQAMTVVEGPIWMRLWERRFATVRMEALDIFPGLKERREGKWALVVHRPVSKDQDIARFASADDAAKFVAELGRSYGLQKMKLKDSGGTWLKLVTCVNTKTGEQSDKMPPAPTEDKLKSSDFLFGIEDFDGTYRGFLDNEMPSEPTPCQKQSE